MVNAIQEREQHSLLNRGAQITPRLEKFFQIVGQQGALRFDQVQRWFGYYSPEPIRMKEATQLSAERTRKILHPWFEQEWFSYRVFFAKQKGWLWLTPKGIKATGLTLRYYEPSPAVLPHLYAVNEIRLLLATRRPADCWRSERELRAEYALSKRHLPDAELLTEKGTINALEVELTLKSEKRLQEILVDLASNARYATIWYFAPEAIAVALRKALRTLPQERRHQFRFYNLQGKEYAS
ncbi:MAG TPA: hypothetical protein VFN35_22850 [Ktedonobacteraceae bacterium]|nr:hypothetical protein [Ktedonobacteraceae bacterium]